jgi:hypothetical protein
VYACLVLVLSLPEEGSFAWIEREAVEDGRAQGMWEACAVDSDERLQGGCAEIETQGTASCICGSGNPIVSVFESDDAVMMMMTTGMMMMMTMMLTMLVMMVMW